MDLIGIEPMTSSMPWKRAPSCATGPLRRGTTPLLSLLWIDSSIWLRKRAPRVIQRSDLEHKPCQMRHLDSKCAVTGNTLGVSRCLRQ